MRAGMMLAALALCMIQPPHASAAQSCHCARRAHSRDWALHHPSTAAERAETARLNRTFGVPPGARIAAAPPAAQTPVDRYREQWQAYDRQMQNYYRAYPPGTGRGVPQPSRQAYARPAPPAAPYAVPPGYSQDAARLDPWHGYNGHGGPGNGY